MDRPEHFVFLLLRDFSHLAFANAVEPLRIANLVSGRPLYRWSFASGDGDMAMASNGSETRVHSGFQDLPECDRLFVLSGINVRDRATPRVLGFLRRARAHGVALGALCSGAYVLARAGVLNGMRTAIHWEFHDAFMEEFPDITLVRNVYVADEPIVSASGGSATADLMLYIIAERHDENLSTAVADQMVYTVVRESSAEQRVSLQARAGARSPRLAHAISLMRASIETPLATSKVASQVGISTRQLERLFGKHLNTSPRKYMQELRLDRARALLVQTEMSVVDIAVACGFESPAHFSRVYRAAFGIRPSHQRQRLS